MKTLTTYHINEVFYSLQGEGARQGTANVFVRFAGCNERCRVETHGFDCDTEFTSGRRILADELIQRMRRLAPDCSNVILTGGEPLLQVDWRLLLALKDAGFYYIAVETNGSINYEDRLEGVLYYPNSNLRLLDWVTVSPKVAEHAIRQREANEVKYVRKFGQELPATVVSAEHYYISPAFSGDTLDPDALAWCVGLIKKQGKEGRWKLTLQMHKLLMIP
jgi:7-carboxy-7-deazaguanine synthase